MPMTIEKAQVTMPSDREVTVTRSFKAPRALVFRAYTEPELVRRWMLGPPGWSMPVCEMDVRVGGSYRWRWRSDTDGKEFGFAGTFREVQPPSRLVHTEAIRSRHGGRRLSLGRRGPRDDDLRRRGRHHDHDHRDGLRIEGGQGRRCEDRHDRRHGAELSAAGSGAPGTGHLNVRRAGGRTRSALARCGRRGCRPHQCLQCPGLGFCERKPRSPGSERSAMHDTACPHER